MLYNTQNKTQTLSFEKNKDSIRNRIIGQRLREARIANGLRAVDVCAAFPELSKSHYSEWENGQKQITVKWLYKLAQHFGVSIDYIVGETDDSNELRTAAEIRRSIVDVSEQYLNQIIAVTGVMTNQQSLVIFSQEQALSAAEELCLAIHRMIELNPDDEGWLSIRGGARVESAVNRFEKSLKSIEMIKRQNQAQINLQLSNAIEKQQNSSPLIFGYSIASARQPLQQEPSASPDQNREANV